MCGKLIRDPHAKLSEQEQAALENIRQWFCEYMIVRDGIVRTKTTGAGFMTSHNWDGVTCDPNTGQILHGAGHCKDNDWQCYFLLLGEHTPDNFRERLEAFRKTLRQPSSNMWVFDFTTTRWQRKFHDGPFVETLGGGSFMKYIPDLNRSIYHQAQGRSPFMMVYDGVKNTWTPAKPNGDKPLGQLIHKDKIAPLQEQQVAYSPKHRKLVAVIDQATHVYDIDKSEWSRLPDDRQLKAHDARTIFDYDDNSDTFLLLQAGRQQGEGSFFGMSLADGKWREIKPTGPLPFARWSPGEGYYDPRHGDHS